MSYLEDTNIKHDFVFMDADKGNYRKYYKLLKEKASTNCIIVVDNAGKLVGLLHLHPVVKSLMATS